MNMLFMKGMVLVIISAALLMACTTPSHAERLVMDDVQVGYASLGEGAVTIVLEAGLGDGMETWDGIIDELSATARVFAYSRPGYPPSSTTNRSRRPGQIVDELRQLLKRTGHPPPYLLVGHSLGGIYVLNFVERYPDEVAGVVLVDGRHPMLPRTCLQRALSGCTMPRLVQALLADHVLDEYKAAQEARMPSAMGEKPLAVVSRAPDRGLESKAWRALWSEMQVGLSELSRRSRHLVARHGGHYVHQDEPAQVIEGVEWVYSVWQAEVDDMAQARVVK
jgi:pimeloyl-ACP methyl ester carboxylesterase